MSGSLGVLGWRPASSFQLTGEPAFHFSSTAPPAFCSLSQVNKSLKEFIPKNFTFYDTSIDIDTSIESFNLLIVLVHSDAINLHVLTLCSVTIKLYLLSQWLFLFVFCSFFRNLQNIST